MLIHQFRVGHLVQIFFVSLLIVLLYRQFRCRTIVNYAPWDDTEYDRYPKAKSVIKDSVHLSSNIHMKYLQEYATTIDGWFSREILYVLWTISQYQYNQLNIFGGIGEIGVHHGKLTCYLYLLRRYQEQTLFAVDVFDNQLLNKDGSGRGQKNVFLQNIRNYAQVLQNEIAMYAGSSLDLNPAFSQNKATLQWWKDEVVGERGLQLVSIDGGHTSLLTYSDLCVIADSLTDGGVVLVDDINHPGWLGVQDGAGRFLSETSTVLSDLSLEDIMARQPNETNMKISTKIVEATKIKSDNNPKPKCARLVPFLLYFNKLFLTTPKFYPYYIELMNHASFFANNQRVNGVNYLEYNMLRLTAGSVPIWTVNHDYNETHKDYIFKQFIEPGWLREVQKIDQQNGL